MTEKVEFLSAAWLKLLHEKLIEFTADVDPKASFGFCESYINVPKHLSKDGTLSFNMVFSNGKIQFAAEKNENAGFVFNGDYEYVAPLAATIVTPANKSDYERRMQEGVKLGKMAHSGDLSSIPPQMNGLHNAMAALTK